MSVNKFGVSLDRHDRDDAITGRIRPAVESLRNYVRDNALCLAATDYDARERRIKRLSEPKEDADAASKNYVERALRAMEEDENKYREEMKKAASQQQYEFVLLTDAVFTLKARVDKMETDIAQMEKRVRDLETFVAERSSKRRPREDEDSIPRE